MSLDKAYFLYIIYRISVVNSVFFHKMGRQFLFLTNC
ncbi:hypothetical protein BACUNI_02765 [Bacteroides uniformis ATCC 8492]|uniref:Uncharacterized protein n=1 Tax=Bacteroides uniformis (strain ATCC 8492 / DSM 6597 / CCUG 4942 / CIP 103695 / JCM 5828 / KCTC 5204 / NCTC 13054 / VPI 0061) TaxID=411479 RepID=A0ABC9N9Q3_BACUC|nr:hypothetical protein BACUNI_02765 [Bacteroides uniformis ATCC 8492]